MTVGDPTSETCGSEATFSASASDCTPGRGAVGSAGFSAAATAAGRGTRTSTSFPSVRTSNSASAASSITTRAVRSPACAMAARRKVPSSIASSRAFAVTSVSAKSTTTRGGEASLSVVNESGRSPWMTTPLVRSSPPTRTPSRCAGSSAFAESANPSARAPHTCVNADRSTIRGR